MKILIKEKLSPHKFKTPEGYLICQDAILARTGKQTYRKNELFLDTDDNSEIEVDRPEEEVFANETLASFENKPVTIEHPDEDVTIDNYKDYSVGFARDIRRGKVGDEDVILGNLVITDKDAIDKIESGEMVELSCGYDCDIVGDDAPKQTHIRGNHIALCEQGRAGIAKIVDSVKDEKQKPEFDALGKWVWDNVMYDWYDTGRAMYYTEIVKNSSKRLDSIKDSELQQYGNLKKGEVYKGTNKFAVANEYWQIQRIWEENGKVLVSYRQYYRLKENIKDEGERVNTYELVWNTMKGCEKLNPSTWRNDEINMYRKSIAKDSIHDYYSSLTPSDREEVYALAQKRGWGLSYEDMVDIYRKHKNGTQKDKEKAELLLEECNYHDELRMLRNKDYDKYKRASGITDSIHDAEFEEFEGYLDNVYQPIKPGCEIITTSGEHLYITDYPIGRYVYVSKDRNDINQRGKTLDKDKIKMIKLVDSVKDRVPDNVVSEYQKKVDYAIQHYGRIGAGLFDELDDAHLWVDERNGQHIVKRQVEDSIHDSNMKFKLDKKTNDYGEYVIQCFKNGQYNEAGSSYTDDWEDAVGTLNAIARQFGLNVRQQGRGYVADSICDAHISGSKRVKYGKPDRYNNTYFTLLSEDGDIIADNITTLSEAKSKLRETKQFDKREGIQMHYTIEQHYETNNEDYSTEVFKDSISSDVNVGDTIIHSSLSNESDTEKFRVVKVDDSMIYARHLDTNETYTINKNQLNNRGWSVMKDSIRDADSSYKSILESVANKYNAKVSIKKKNGAVEAEFRPNDSSVIENLGLSFQFAKNIENEIARYEWKNQGWDKGALKMRNYTIRDSIQDSEKLFKVNGTYVSANNMVDAIKKHRDSKVKDSTPINIKARLVWTENGHLKHKEISHDELERLGRGNRRTADYEGKTGGILPRRELWNQPTLKGFLGPMYDGDAIRYESQSANDILSI